MARSRSRSRSRSPRKGDRRRERDWRDDRERVRDRDWESKTRVDRGRERERGGRGDRSDEGRTRERERGRSGSPRHDHQRHTDDYEARRDARGRGRSRDAGNDFAEVERPHRKGTDRREDEIMRDPEGQRAAIVAEFVDGIVREHEQLAGASLHTPPPPRSTPGPPSAPTPDEEDIMKKMGIPTGFNTTKGKYVGDANHSAVKLTTKRMPRQYMNRRGGFNRPLPAETNR